MMQAEFYIQLPCVPKLLMSGNAGNWQTWLQAAWLQTLERACWQQNSTSWVVMHEQLMSHGVLCLAHAWHELNSIVLCCGDHGNVVVITAC